MERSCSVLSVLLLLKCVTGWSTFNSLGGNIIHVASSSWGPDRMNVFGAASNGQIYHKSFIRGYWSDWESLGGYTLMKPSAFSIKPNWVDVVYTGPDRMLYRKTWNGYSWNDWRMTAFQGLSISGPTITASPEDTTNLHVFGVSADRGLYHGIIDITTDRVSLWENLGGELIGDPAAVSYGGSRFDVFSVAYDNQIWQKTYDNGWAKWKVLYGGQYKPGLAAASMGPGYINVFGRGLDDAVYYRSFGYGQWNTVERVGGRFKSSPTAVSTGSTRVDFFAADSDGAVYHSYSDTRSEADPSN